MSKAQNHSEGEQDQEAQVPPALRGPHDCYEAQILRRVWNRLHRRNEHFVMALVGREGSGKSLTSLRLAKEVDPSFNADRVIFDVSELLRILNEGDHEPGNAYVLDEAGVSLGVRTWQDRSQVLANQALQLVRSHNLALFFTLPALGELDSQAQNRLQAFYEIRQKVPDEYVEGKWKYIQPDRTAETRNLKTPFPRVYENGVRKRVTTLKFRPPDEELAEAYKERKSQHQQEFYEETLAEFEEDEEEAVNEEIPAPKIAEEILDVGYKQYVREINNGTQRVLDKSLIRKDYDVSTRKAKDIKNMVLAEVQDSTIM